MVGAKIVQRQGRLGVEADVDAVVRGGRWVVDRCDRQGQRGRGGAAFAIGHGVGGNRHGATVVGFGREGVDPVAADLQGAHPGDGGGGAATRDDAEGLLGAVAVDVNRELGDPEDVEVDIGVVTQHVAGQAAVLDHRPHVVVGGGRTVAGQDGVECIVDRVAAGAFIGARGETAGETLPHQQVGLLGRVATRAAVANHTGVAEGIKVEAFDRAASLEQSADDAIHLAGHPAGIEVAQGAGHVVAGEVRISRVGRGELEVAAVDHRQRIEAGGFFAPGAGRADIDARESHRRVFHHHRLAIDVQHIQVLLAGQTLCLRRINGHAQHPQGKGLPFIALGVGAAIEAHIQAVPHFFDQHLGQRLGIGHATCPVGVQVDDGLAIGSLGRKGGHGAMQLLSGAQLHVQAVLTIADLAQQRLGRCLPACIRAVLSTMKQRKQGVPVDLCEEGLHPCGGLLLCGGPGGWGQFVAAIQHQQGRLRGLGHDVRLRHRRRQRVDRLAHRGTIEHEALLKRHRARG